METFYKPEIRKKMIKRREQLGKESITKVAAQVAAELVLMPPFLEAKHIGFYVATQGECDPALAAHSAYLLGKALYLPVMSDKKDESIAYYRYEWDAPLVKNQYGIQEPDINNQIPAPLQELDCLLIPLVAFDVNCNRLGRGAGCFDRYFAALKNMSQLKRPTLIGLGYAFQKIDAITPDEWDIPMDYVVTEDRVYKRIEE